MMAIEIVEIVIPRLVGPPARWLLTISHGAGGIGHWRLSDEKDSSIRFGNHQALECS